MGRGGREEIWRHTKLHFQSLPGSWLSEDGKDVISTGGVMCVCVCGEGGQVHLGFQTPPVVPSDFYSSNHSEKCLLSSCDDQDQL